MLFGKQFCNRGMRVFQYKTMKGMCKMTNRKYRTALIGCGGRGREHMKGVLEDERCEVVALSDVNEAAAEMMKASHGLNAAVYPDYRKMLKEVRPDVVIASVWTALHLPVFRDCAEAGVRAVLCEKPMAPTWRECLEMAAIAERTGCQLTFSHQRRFASGNRKVREMIAEGVFGEIVRMDLYSWPHLLDCGTHTFDQALSFIGEKPAAWVLGAVDASEPISYFNVKAEKTAVGLVEFAGGLQAAIAVGVPKSSMGAGVRLFGTKGWIEVGWDGEFGACVVYDRPSWRPEPPEPQPNEQMIGVVRNAIDSLESGEEPELSYKKALRATEIIFAFYESVRRHARVELPLTGVEDNPFISMLEAGQFAG
jgi:predicted dehydrogenase